MGPAFSGSAASLSFVLDKWRESHSNIPNVRFQIISGTATAIDASWISQAAQQHETFQATVPPDSETLQAIACYIDGLGYPKIAILTEGNTAYGQNFSHQSAPQKGAAGRSRLGCENGQSPPEILSLPFPMHISRLRAAASKANPQQGQAGSGTGSANPASTPPAEESATEPREVLPSFSDLSVQSAELTLANLLSTISREQYSYVGIVATDVRDVTFLAQEVRQHCPATVLFTLNSDLLYAYPDVNSATRGMIIITPYPALQSRTALDLCLRWGQIASSVLESGGGGRLQRDSGTPASRWKDGRLWKAPGGVRKRTIHRTAQTVPMGDGDRKRRDPSRPVVAMEGQQQLHVFASLYR